MLAPNIPIVYDDLLDSLLQYATPEEILALKPSERASERTAELLDRNNAGLLTETEQAELDLIVYFDSKISLLKARAAAQLKQQKTQS